MSTEKEARCSRCDEVVGVVVTTDGRATIRLSTSSHGDTLPITCPRALPRPTDRTDRGEQVRRLICLLRGHDETGQAWTFWCRRCGKAMRQ